MKSPKILIISNDLSLYRRLEIVLITEGYQVFYNQSTDTQLKSVLDEMNPDLVIVDPEVPSFRGIGISLLVRQFSPAPILMLTPASTDQGEIQALNMESADYLSEPFDIRLVTARIEQILSASPA